jgi:hypothetical protein
MAKKNPILHNLELALDPVAFAQSIGFTPDSRQAEALRFNGNRLMLNCSRQSGKSTTTAIKALHAAVFHPHSLILLTSPTERQSKELFRKLKDCMNSMETPPQLLEDNKLSVTMANQSRIVSLPGDPATVRGYSNVNLILEDEAAQVADEFYNAMLPMLTVSKGQIILMSTPFGKRGHFFEEWESGNGWKKIKVTSDMCPRIDGAILEEQRRSMGDMFFKQEYECEFVDNEQQTFSYEILRDAFDEKLEVWNL